MVENLVRFANLLRREGFRAGLSSVLDAAMGLHLIEPWDVESFETLLIASFVSSGEELPKFRKLFRDFWLAREEMGLSPQEEAYRPSSSGKRRVSSMELGDSTAQRERHPSFERKAYSPKERNSPVEVEVQVGELETQAVKALRSLLRAFSNRPSRRMTPSPSGSRFSLSRTLRKSLQYGGDLLYLQFLDPKIRKNSALLLCDVSGSMEEHGRFALELGYVLLRAARNSEVFFFSTELVRVTHLLKKWPVGEFPFRISEAMAQWGAGTRIGPCLRSLRQRFGASLLSKRPIVMVLSDGWDQGDTEILRREMELLRAKARAIVWFNPLLKTPGYEPTCRGMATALPYLDYFLPLADFEDLRCLALRFRGLKRKEGLSARIGALPLESQGECHG
jgi:uncharacterized protein with von Willebrand factor type A (vWA) domain